MLLGFIIIGVFIIILVDFIFYTKAKYPERKTWYYKLPFGGIVAYLKFK